MEESLSLKDGLTNCQGSPGSSVTTSPQASSPSHAYSNGNFAPCGIVQLSYLPQRSELPESYTLAFPMYLPMQMHAALQNGQSISVIMAVLDDTTAEDPEEKVPSETLPWRQSGRGSRRTPKLQRAKWTPKSQEKASLSLREVDAKHLCTEEGSKEACRKMAANPDLANEFAFFVKSRLGFLMRSRPGSRFLCELLARLPYGRSVAPESEAALVVTELIESLPRAAMQATGKSVYAVLLEKIRKEGPIPSKTTRAFSERLSKNVSPLVQCRYGAQVLLEAFEVDCMGKLLETAVAAIVEDVCKTPPGCEFLTKLLESPRSLDVAMALLESRECFQSLSWDSDWSKLLVRASEFGSSHRTQLADRVRRATPEERQRCTHEVKLAACWK